MDSLTHIFLGGAIAQSLFVRPLKRYAWIVGGIAATLPDLDVFLHTGDSVRDHAFHRYFLHSLALNPLLALIAVLPFAASRRLHAHWRKILLAAFLAALSHPLLDACTSYGTCLLWPFSDARIAWDIIAIADPFFTLPLLLGMIAAARWHTPRPARIALSISAAYLILAAFQHHRAQFAQTQLLASRHLATDHARVLPLIGSITTYRSIYRTDETLQADTLRLGFFSTPLLRPGTSLPLAHPDPSPQASLFQWFADGYVAADPQSPAALGDMRYSAASNTFTPLWGLDTSQAPPTWITLPHTRSVFLQHTWRDITSNRGFAPLAAHTE